jgi:hypothetical protein
MMDPVAMLAINVAAQPGVYALLLGSGISSAAGIPTGHHVTIDLIRRLALARGEECEPDPEEWFTRSEGTEPSYSNLLEGLAPRPAERAAILREYFEANDEDRDAGRKIPSRAHRAIARLVASGDLRVIITTNFDRLLEGALEEVGIRPVVISTDDAVLGAPPLQHSLCTVIKVNGDYLDSRIRNTEEELAEYPEQLNSLLDRVLDEYGLVICGWSATWDGALCSAIERCPSRRYTSYGASRTDPSDIAEKLIGLRQAVPISIDSADDFFERLESAVLGLKERRIPGHLAGDLTSPAGVVSELKRSLDDPMRRIALHDLIRDEGAALAESVRGDGFSASSPEPTIELAASRMRAYEDLATPAIAIMATGCYYARDDQMDLFIDLLEEVANAPHNLDGSTYTMWTDLQRYPSTLLTYAGGISAVAAGRDEIAALILTKPQRRPRHGDPNPLGLDCMPSQSMRTDWAQQLPFLSNQRLLVPMSEHLLDIMREPLQHVIRARSAYERAFNRYEYLAALTQADLSRESYGGPWYYIGRFGWIARSRSHEDVTTEVDDEIRTAGTTWPPLRVGAFGGDAERVQAAITAVRQGMQRVPW